MLALLSIFYGLLWTLMDSYGLLYIVDDEADYRFILQKVFSHFLSSYPVRFFSDGHALLETLSLIEEKPNLILLDRHMPNLNGQQTLLQLKQHPTYHKIPVVMMSAEASLAEIEASYEAGVNSFLFKSKDLPSLKNKMTAICQYWLELNWEPVKPIKVKVT
ncbi:MAG: response regulator [Spirosoma sp.]|nr:response regulator [Spirosoma sp.]